MTAPKTAVSRKDEVITTPQVFDWVGNTSITMRVKLSDIQPAIAKYLGLIP